MIETAAQSYTAELTYPLINQKDTPIQVEIALPPDTHSQRVELIELTPWPEAMRVDADGNLLATYSLLPLEETQIRSTARITVGTNPEYPEPQLEGLTTTESEYWQLPQSSTLPSVPSSINSFVVESIEYRYPLDGERKGAQTALQNQAGVCQEYTDVFIALARTAGIPARRHVGYAYVAGDETRPLGLGPDILHVWPEYYSVSEDRWKFADPTWEHTTGGEDYFSTFDTNHITFAINGQSATIPAAAGMYGQQSTAQQVLVRKDTSSAPVKTLFTPAVSLQEQSLLKSFLSRKYDITIQNESGLGWYSVAFTTPEPNQIHASATKLLPLEQTTITYTTNNHNWIPQKEPVHLFVTTEYNTTSYELESVYHISGRIQAITGLLTACLAWLLIIGARRAWRLLVSGQKSDSALRW